MLRLDQFEVVGALGMFGRSRTQLDLNSFLRFRGQLVENPHAEKCRRQRAQDALFDILALDRLRVRAAGTAEFIDRKPLLVIGAAIAILAHDRVRPCAFSAFQQPRQEIRRAVRGIQGVRRRIGKQLADFLLASLDLCPKLVRNDPHLGHI
ncbi:hypothetical protein LQK84_20370 [Rhizobium sp. C4]|nr:hypothetical protein [Rhizobium sp. C4]MCD2175319.1 hypothetical protein [Rhizobium sp. C4]